MDITMNEVDAKLDELADICEHWKRNRERGHTPDAIKGALLMLVAECAALTQQHAKAPGADEEESE